MTSAKPQPMAGQTEAPDDLIAELARLMADDARGETPAQPAAPQVRIPGGDIPTPPKPSPVPRFDFQQQSAPAQPARTEPVVPPTIRIPGEPAPVPASKPAAETPDPFSFDFDLNLGNRKQGPSSAVAPEPRVNLAPQPSVELPPVPPAPQVSAPAAPVPQMDHDSIADLIAAEFANEAASHAEADEPPAEIPVVSGPARGEDVFGVPPLFGLATAKVAPSEPVVPVVTAVTELEAPKVQPQPELRAEPVMARVESAPEPQIAQRPAPAPASAPAPAPASAPAPTSSEADTLAEIERLIGSAVNLDPPAAPAASPALRSLATPTLPRTEPEPQKPAAPDNLSIDEAILAAAAATGAKVEWVEPPVADEPVAEERFSAPRKRARSGIGFNRAVAGPLVAVGLLAVAGGALYWMLGNNAAPSGPAPLLTADTSAVKEVPEVEPAPSAPQSIVFNEMAGGNNGEGEQIVSRDQTDVPAVTQEANFDPSQDGLVNRKVRTVTVRPDGTIVSGTDSVAGTSMLPVDRPEVPEVPGADFSTPDLLGNPSQSNEAVASVDPTPAPTPSVTPVQPGTFVPVVDVSGNPVSGKTAPVPRLRPSNFAQLAAAAPVAAPVSQAQPAQAAAPAPQQTTGVASTVNSAPAYVQLSSQRSEEAARQSANDILRRFGPVFGGAQLEVQRVDLGERGIFYRVRVPADSLQSANVLCTNIKAAGGDCFTM